MSKLLNLDEEIPPELFIFVNQLSPITYWNFNIIKKFSSGAFTSIDFPGILEKYLSGTIKYLPYEPCKMDAIAVSPYFLTAINDYRIEYDIEVYREKHHRTYPSRLSAIYAFGDYQTCVEVNRKYGWPLSEVRKFKLIEHRLNRVVRVNMEHVSLARHAYKVSALEALDRLWGGYWSGVDNIVVELPVSNLQRKQFESGVVWEYLIEGTVENIE
jgi:hypothetical protein